MKKRCPWAGVDPLYIAYHDKEWGVPVHNDKKLFEFLILEGAQAGLSWITILKKRQSYKEAFADFDPARVSKFTNSDINRLLRNKGIVRNKLKIKSAVVNAKAFLRVQKEFGTFDRYIWQFVNHKPIINERRSLKNIPAYTKLSSKISHDLKRRGFNFVGPTIVYAFMQAVGVVNDHLIFCWRYK